MSQVIFASCTASESTFFRPEWGQFPRPQVEYPPPCSTKSPGGTCPCPWRLPLLSKGAVLLRGSPVKPADLNIEATCRLGAAPPMAAFEQPAFATLARRLRQIRRASSTLAPQPIKTGEELARPPLAASPFPGHRIPEPDQLAATGAASGPTCVYPLGQEKFYAFLRPAQPENSARN